MCEPVYFDVQYVINPWMEGNQGKVDKALADRQWRNLFDVVARRASIKLITPVPGLPDMVFTANGGFVSPRHEVIISSFRHAERKPESPLFRKFFEEADYRVVLLSEGTEFEGAGDALFDATGTTWTAAGFRSSPAAEREIARTLNVAPHGVVLVNPRWYHLDTAFCPLPRGEVMAYARAFSAESVESIQRAFGDKAIWVSDADANNFACNAVSVGDDVILHKASDALKSALDKKKYNVIEVEVSEFLKAGGSCKCMTLDLQTGYD